MMKKYEICELFSNYDKYWIITKKSESYKTLEEIIKEKRFDKFRKGFSTDVFEVYPWGAIIGDNDWSGFDGYLIRQITTMKKGEEWEEDPLTELCYEDD